MKAEELVEEKKNGLGERLIWIIDDAIPINLYKGEKDELLSGKLPIDRGVLATLINEDGWEDEHVKSLAQQLLEQAGNVVAYTNPAHAVEQLSKGSRIPDGVVFDLNYKPQPDKSKTLDQLKQLMEACVTVLQVYTNESAESAVNDLATLPTQIKARLEEPLTKSEVNAEKLSATLEERISKSLSLAFAQEVRKLTYRAVEKVLIHIDGIPLETAIRLLAGNLTSPKQQELIELVAEKIGEDLVQRKDIYDAIEKFGTSNGLAKESAPALAKSVIHLLKAHVQDHILEDQGFAQKMAASLEAAKSEKGKGEKVSEDIIKGFESFRLYSRPKDDFVRTGDIVYLPKKKLFIFVLTPQCDLERFWRKTRGILTILPMYPLSDKEGIPRARSFGNELYGRREKILNVVNRHPYVLPSVRVDDSNYRDFSVYAYEMGRLVFPNAEYANKSEKELKNIPALSYSELGDISRRCKLSEPYLSGLLDAIKRDLFRIGIPDFAKEEATRIENIFGKKP